MHGQGLFVIASTCGDCNGQGRRNSHHCRECDGAGKSQVRRTINVKIPAGFDDGMSLRYQGQGDAGTGGGPPGDLYISAGTLRIHSG